MFGFDFNFDGNHDEVVAEALGVGHGLEGLFDLPQAQVINYEPSMTLALNESCQLQCRLAVETRTNAYQVRTREYSDDQISVYFTVRQYWGTGPRSELPRFVAAPAGSRRGDPPAVRDPAGRPAPGAGDRIPELKSARLWLSKPGAWRPPCNIMRTHAP